MKKLKLKHLYEWRVDVGLYNGSFSSRKEMNKYIQLLTDTGAGSTNISLDEHFGEYDEGDAYSVDVEDGVRSVGQSCSGMDWDDLENKSIGLVPNGLTVRITFNSKEEAELYAASVPDYHFVAVADICEMMDGVCKEFAEKSKEIKEEIEEKSKTEKMN